MNHPYSETVSFSRRLLAFLTMLVFLMSAFGRASVAWACEGRVCSADVARCCCASLLGKRDDSCLTLSEGKTSTCGGRCGCTAVVTKVSVASPYSAPKAFQAVALLYDEAVVPPTVFLVPAYVLLETPQVRAIPPPDRLPDPPCVTHASLRAPPATA